MQVTCSCSKVLNVPDTLIGKTARCPACKKILQMPGAPPTADRIVVACSCGKKLAVPTAAAGKKVKCPKCGQELSVPAPAGKPAPAKKLPPSPVITPMPPPASYTVKPAAPIKPPPMSEDLAFDVEIEETPPEPPKNKAASPVIAPVAESEDLMFDADPVPPEAHKPPEGLPVDSPGGAEEKDQYGLGSPKCPNCKADLAMGAQFCVECGTALATGAKTQSVAAPKKKLKFQLGRKQVKLIIIGVIVAAAIGIAGYYGYKTFHKAP